jgi:hypothetical protein
MRGGIRVMRPGYVFDNHKLLMDQLHIIMDKAAVEYDQDEDVVDDFTQYVKDWASRRSEETGKVIGGN